MANVDDIVQKLLQLAQDKGGTLADLATQPHAFLTRGSALESSPHTAWIALQKIKRAAHEHGWSIKKTNTEQARALADKTADQPHTAVVPPYALPSYSSLTYDQLINYLAWRTDTVRTLQAGKPLGDDPCPAWAALYIRELCCGIDHTRAHPPEVAACMIALWKTHCSASVALSQLVAHWIAGYCVVHRLTLDGLRDVIDPAPHTALTLLARIEAWTVRGRASRKKKATLPSVLRTLPTTQVLAAFSYASGIDFDSEEWIDTNQLLVAYALIYLYQGLIRRSGRINAPSYTEYLFGELQASYEHPLASCEMELSAHSTCGGAHSMWITPLEGYVCYQGNWLKFALSKPVVASPQLARTVRELLHHLGQYHGVSIDHKTATCPDYLSTLCQRAVDDAIALTGEQAAKRPHKITLNPARIGHARAGARIACDLLITDEELEQERDTSVREQHTTPHSQASDEKHLLLRALLDGTMYASSQPFDLIVDEINDWLFDELGDTAIEFDDKGNPVVIADYRSEIEQILARDFFS